MVERREDAGGQVHSDVVVAGSRDDVHGQAALLAKRLQVAAAGEEGGEVESGQVLVRSLLAVSRADRVDELGEALFQALVVEALALERALAPVCDEDVGVFEQREEGLAPLLRFRVDGDVELVRVLQLPRGVLVPIEGPAFRGGREPQGVALGGLDLDDRRSLVGQETAGRGGRDEVRQFDDFDAFEQLL